MRIIEVNSGSSSIKYESFDMSPFNAAAIGLLERIGTSDSRLKHRWLDPSGHGKEILETRAIADHREGFSLVLEVSSRARAGTTPEAVFGVGHRVVHGGERFKEPAIIDDRTLTWFTGTRTAFSSWSPTSARYTAATALEGEWSVRVKSALPKKKWMKPSVTSRPPKRCGTF